MNLKKNMLFIAMLAALSCPMSALAWARGTVTITIVNNMSGEHTLMNLYPTGYYNILQAPSAIYNGETTQLVIRSSGAYNGSDFMGSIPAFMQTDDGFKVLFPVAPSLVSWAPSNGGVQFSAGPAVSGLATFLPPAHQYSFTPSCSPNFWDGLSDINITCYATGNIVEP